MSLISRTARAPAAVRAAYAAAVPVRASSAAMTNIVPSQSQRRGVHTEERMKELGIELPAYQDAVWSYVKAQKHGDAFYIGDHVGQDETATTVRGKVGEEPEAEVTPEEAEKLAENSALRLLSTLSHFLDGNLDRVEQVVMVNGYVNGTPEFRGHGKVINGCSNMLVQVLGDRGKHARSCVGAGSLPAAVTCDMIVRVKDE
jgi:enamine deaminase RidA (YjgF/YER057c/UK114 family)